MARVWNALADRPFASRGGGEFMGIAATGNTINVNVCDYFRVGNGALIEHWGVMDAAGMMQQLTAP